MGGIDSGQEVQVGKIRDDRQRIGRERFGLGRIGRRRRNQNMWVDQDFIQGEDWAGQVQALRPGNEFNLVSVDRSGGQAAPQTAERAPKHLEPPPKHSPQSPES